MALANALRSRSTSACARSQLMPWRVFKSSLSDVVSISRPRSNEQLQMLAFPRGNALREGLELFFLHRAIGLHELFAEHVREFGALEERLERIFETARQFVFEVVGAFDHWRRRFLLLHHAKIAAGEGGRHRQIRIDVDARH